MPQLSSDHSSCPWSLGRFCRLDFPPRSQKSSEKIRPRSLKVGIPDQPRLLLQRRHLSPTALGQVGMGEHARHPA